MGLLTAKKKAYLETSVIGYLRALEKKLVEQYGLKVKRLEGDLAEAP